MNRASYSDRVDTGVQWLGEIPKHWKCAALSRFTVARCDGPFGSSLRSEHYVESGVRVIRLQNIGVAEFRDQDKAFIDTDYFNQKLTRHAVEAGDLLVAGLGDQSHPVGRACAAPAEISPAMVKADCFRFRLRTEVLRSHFAAYQLSALATVSAGALATGATRSRTNLSVTSARKLAIPPVEEQDAIATFLDRETAKIDALIDKKQRLIELLQEKRTALITQAVTKGLDPDVEMKDSGVEWLGEIPAHWEQAQLGRLVESFSGGTPDRGERRYWDGEIPWVSPKDMKVRDVENSMDRITEEALRRSGIRLIQPPSVLIVVRGMILDHTFPVARALRPVTINQDMKALIPRPGLKADYLTFALQGLAPGMLALVERAAHGTCKLRSSNWKSFELPVPPETEQGLICDHLHSSTRQLEEMIASVFGAIDLLREYRTALISAAVTGKIDVREEL